MKFAIALVALFACLTVAMPAQDSVAPRSGDKLAGKVVAVDQASVSIDTGGAVRQVVWADVAAVTTAAPVAVTLANGDKVTVRLMGVSAGRMQASSETLGDCSFALAGLAPAAPAPAPKKDTPLTPSDWKGKVSLNGAFHSGNISSSTAALRAGAEKSWEEDKVAVAIEALYGRSDGQTTAAAWVTRGRYDHFFSKSFYGYGSAELGHDQIQNISLRGIFNLGVGDVLWKESDDRLLAVEGGISAIYEDYRTADPSKVSPAGRAAATYKEVLFDIVKFTQDVELLVPLNDAGRFLARSRSVFSVPLSKSWSMNTSLELNFQGRPPASTKSLDILALVGLEYQF